MRQDALSILREGTCIPATPLALDEERAFDRRRQHLLMQYYLNSGCGGIATAVHTTQFEIHDPANNLLETVLQSVAEDIINYEQTTGRTIIRIAGVCGETSQAMHETVLAKNLGYDAVLLSPGGLDSLSEQDLIRRTMEVGQVLPVIGFYLQPAVGGRVLSYAYWEELCALDSVIAIKVAPFNRYDTLDVVRAAATSHRCDEISLYTGNDDHIVLDLLSSFSFHTANGMRRKDFAGGLLGHWSVWTYKAVKLFDRIMREKKQGVISAELLQIANEITDCNSAFFDASNQFRGVIAGLHHVLHRQGLMDHVWCLNPDERLSDGQMEQIERVYTLYPHLHDDDFVREHITEWKRDSGLITII